eukprot:1729442-Pleurochrysis_carterae.AAC.1
MDETYLLTMDPSIVKGRPEVAQRAGARSNLDASTHTRSIDTHEEVLVTHEANCMHKLRSGRRATCCVLGTVHASTAAEDAQRTHLPSSAGTGARQRERAPRPHAPANRRTHPALNSS